MNENESKVITVDDFNVICRVCLQMEEGMTDIFESGLKNQLVEVTSLKVEINDKLPQALCQKCSNQIDQLYLFLQQAKSSDIYLRSLLSKSVNNFESEEKLKATQKSMRRRKPSRKKLQKWHRKSKKIKSDLESDKMYLIYVPETDNGEVKADNEIYVKDLTSDYDNLGLTNYCKTLVRSHFSDHTYPKEQKSSDNNGNQLEIFKSSFFTNLKFNESKTFMVNLHMYECGECNLTFEESDDLTAHLSTHLVKPNFIKNNYFCPVCNYSVEEKSNFMEHLKTHKEDGFSFLKINPEGDVTPVKENEKHLFLESFSENTKDCRVFSINLNSMNCTICSENIQSTDSIPDHLESCLSKEKSDIKFDVIFTCPVCLGIFSNEKNFLNHLSSHKEENCYFIKVDRTGEPVQTEGETLFVPFEETVKIFSKKSTVFEIIDMNSCDKCDYVSETFSELFEHCSSIHCEKISTEIPCYCYVCLKEFTCSDVDENQSKFYEHLKIHKNEGVCFISVKKNGKMSVVREKYSEIFTQSQFLWHIINSSNLIFQNVSPELVILDEGNSLSEYVCDFCQEQFKNKHEIIVHIKSHQNHEAVQESVNYICEKCGKKCSGKTNYKKHFLKHSKVLSSICRRPICKICNKKFANRATLNGHMRHHLKEENGNEFHHSLLGIICEKCGRSFSNNASLTKHKKMHLKEKENTVLKCEICDRDFFRQSSFDRHKSAHLNPKYFECNICKLPLSSVASLQKHSEIHKNGSNTFDCKACQLSFLTKDSLTAHQTHTGHYLDRKPLECNVCHEKFYIGKKFSEHIKTHPKYKMGECTLCGKRLSTIQSLMLHMGRHFESNSILCPHCGKQFFEERNYHRHLMTHEGIKPFACDVESCKKSFYTLFELNRHKKYHNNTRDFRCPYCSKSFHEANHLTVHVRTHTGERPYTCPHCNKGFVTRTHCKHHIKLVHQGVGYDLIRSNISKKVTVFEAVEATA